MTSLVRLTESMNTNIRVLQKKTTNQNWGNALPLFNPVWRGFKDWRDDVVEEKGRLDRLCIFNPQEEPSKKVTASSEVADLCETITSIIHKRAV